MAELLATGIILADSGDMSFYVQVPLAGATQKRAGSDMNSPILKKPRVSAEEKAEREAIKMVERAEKEAARLAEKAAREAERLAKEAEKEEAKSAERAVKEAERLAREAEKEAKRLEREEKKRLKEEARAQEVALQEEKKRIKEDLRAKEAAEKEKKEKSQLRMGNFFKKADPKPPLPILAKEESSIFKPFHLKESTILAQIGSKSIGDSDDFDVHMKEASEEVRSIQAILKLQDNLRRKRRTFILANSRSRLTLRQRLMEVSKVPLESRLRDLRYKLLQFHSDVRPAYFGTMTTTPHAKGVASGRNPYARTTDLNYDYDSEADWIEGDDDDAGEELGDDDDMSVVSRDTYGEEGDDFLDDEEDLGPREKRNNGQLVPSILGIFSPEDSTPLHHMRMIKLVDTDLPIDPYENYWEPRSTGPVEALSAASKSVTGSKDPNHPQILTLRKSSTNSPAAGFPEKLLPDFKKAIQGCNLTKILLVEKLRVDFKPYKISKKVIEDKLSEVAQRQGKSQHDVWTLKC